VAGSSGFEMINVALVGEQDVAFSGKLIEAVEAVASDPSMKDHDQWARLAIYELESGDWIAVRYTEATSVQGSPIGDYRKFRRSDDDMLVLDGNDLRPVEHDESWLHQQVMSFFEWSWLAKRLAAKAGWKVVREIS
jgi:hypothetical protein